MRKEADIVRDMVRALNRIPGVFCLRTHGGSFQAKGTPDIFGCALGRAFVIEAKRTASLKPSDAQLYMLGKFNDAGAQTFVSHDPKVEEVVTWINSLPR